MTVKNSVARIGKVTLKAGLKIVTLSPQQYDKDRSTFLEHSRSIASWHKPGEVAGWAMVVWRPNGSYSVSHFIGDESPIREAMLPSFVGDVVRRRLHDVGEW
jgi:hypothetical protein